MKLTSSILVLCVVASFALRSGNAQTNSLGIKANTPDSSPKNEFADAVQSLIGNFVKLDKKSVGVVVGIVDEHGSRIFSCGKTDNPSSSELNGDTVFEIGSITKVFTTLLLQDLVERGDMKLDDPVSRYLPDTVKMPSRNGKQITLIQLASHSSGLPRDAANATPKDKENQWADYTPQQLYAFLSGYTLTRDPGEKWEYSNLGVGLLGHVIALKAGSDYETLVLDRICRPLKMDSTRITLTPELKARLAKGHTTAGEPAVNMEFQTLLGNGALRSTANDMLKFLSANCGLTQSDLKTAMEKTRAVQIEHQALGWSRDDSGNFWKNGGTYGYRCDAGFNPEKHRGVIVLSNSRSDDDEIDEMAGVLIQAEWQPDKRLNPPLIDRRLYALYSGDYKLNDGSILHVCEQDGRLLIQRKGHLTGELMPKTESTFLGRISGKELTFVRDAEGKVIQINLLGGSQPIVATRL
jgi:CubicO group peptidase (beta-lactamase class C family)